MRAATTSVLATAGCGGAALAAASAVTLISPCPPSTPVCTVAPGFAAGCVASGGGAYTLDGLPVCALRAPAVQLAPFGGASCYTTGAANFTAGCERGLRGFVSGAAGGGAPAFCVSPLLGAALFAACPPGASVCRLEPGFEDACAAVLGGFVDAYLGPKWGTDPQCAAAAAVLRACPAGTSVCAVDPGFTTRCTALGGFYAGTADGAPFCFMPGEAWDLVTPCEAAATGGCTYDAAEFAAACTELNGFITATADGQSVCAVGPK